MDMFNIITKQNPVYCHIACETSLNNLVSGTHKSGSNNSCKYFIIYLECFDFNSESTFGF